VIEIISRYGLLVCMLAALSFVAAAFAVLQAPSPDPEDQVAIIVSQR
jgi:hypothetical protein